VNARAERFPLMDSLRGIAALTVVAIHVALPSGRLNPGVGGIRYVGRLDVGVAIFFLISGFLLYRPFVKARALGEPQPSTRAYLWRRALRIVPAYWLALTVTALALGLHSVFTGRGLWTYYGFAQIYSNASDIGGISQAWTLCVEVTFYLFLPLWAWIVRRARVPELAGCALLFAAAVAWKIPFVAGHDPIPATWALRALPAFLDHFALGMAMAVLSVRWQEQGLPRGVRLLDRWPGLAWLFAAVAFWVVSTRIGLSGELFEPVNPHQFLLRHELYGLVGLGMLVPAVVGDPSRGFVRRHVLGNRALLWLGLLSYGIYLWHQTAVRWLLDLGIGDVRQPLLPPVFFVAAVALATLLAAVSYYGFERPILSLKRLVDPRTGRRVLAGEALAEPAPAAPPATP
jgi:peptidoglycan/LPS O-acetylase OafA/YrhL